MSPMRSLFSWSSFVLSVLLHIHRTFAFKLLFPTSSWVSCQLNVLQWSYDNQDPDIFSVALFNANRSMVNGNYQIANSLQTKNGTALVRPNCVDPGAGYYVVFVNASKFAENQPEIYYTSPTFNMLPNSFEVPTPEGTRLSADKNTLSGVTTSTLNASSTVNATSASNNAPPSYGPANAATPLHPITSSSSANAASTLSVSTRTMHWLTCLAAIVALAFLSSL